MEKTATFHTPHAFGKNDLLISILKKEGFKAVEVVPAMKLPDKDTCDSEWASGFNFALDLVREMNGHVRGKKFEKIIIDDGVNES